MRRPFATAAALAAAFLLAPRGALAQSLGVSFPFNISNTISDHAVLQRAPQAAVLWGFGKQFAPITATLSPAAGNTGSGVTVSGWVSSLGVWRLSLPPMPAGGPYVLAANSTETGEGFVVNDILFGDVVICGGQSA